MVTYYYNRGSDIGDGSVSLVFTTTVSYVYSKNKLTLKTDSSRENKEQEFVLNDKGNVISENSTVPNLFRYDRDGYSSQIAQGDMITTYT